MSDFKERIVSNIAIALMSVSALLLGGTSARSAHAGNLTRTVSVNAPASEVWSQIGGFCSIRDWHPFVGVCITDGKRPPTRTLITKDGKVSFVEREMGRDDASYSYSYSFVSSPLPTRRYLSTLRVSTAGPNASVITWHGEFTAEPGKDKDVEAALAGVYDNGLAALKARFK